jgi:hypothetical protein
MEYTAFMVTIMILLIDTPCAQQCATPATLNKHSVTIWVFLVAFVLLCRVSKFFKKGSTIISLAIELM